MKNFARFFVGKMPKYGTLAMLAAGAMVSTKSDSINLPFISSSGEKPTVRQIQLPEVKVARTVSRLYLTLFSIFKVSFSGSQIVTSSEFFFLA